MFEKEAEKRITEQFGTSGEYMTRIRLWQDGAEFGYNKGYHDAEEHYMNVIDSQHKLVEESKANEWHYVKDGDLPPLDTNVLVIHRWARTPEVGKRIKAFINSSVWVWAMCSDRFRYTSDDENVIAWKEIVLPELPKGE